MSLWLAGVGVSRGVAIGAVHRVHGTDLDIPEYHVDPESLDAEVERFETALDDARAQLAHIREQIPANAPSEIGAFIETHLLMMQDSALTDTVSTLIRDHRCNAEWAMKMQAEHLTAVFDEMDDSYLRARRDDVVHVAARIQRILLKQERRIEPGRPDDDTPPPVIVADDLTPADIILLHQQGVAAFVTERGGPLSHSAILARSLRIPAVAGLHAARRMLMDDETVVVDGEAGHVLAAPDAGALEFYRHRQKRDERYRRMLGMLKDETAVSTDGVRVHMMANVELPDDSADAAEVGAEGIGLYRTEFLYMNRDETPGEEEQLAAYRRVLRSVDGPVTIRTLDLGADKTIGREAKTSSNPALGLRAIRLCLKETDLFRTQLRALLRASAEGDLRIMLPMISNIQELRQTRHLIDEVMAELRRDGLEYDPKLPVGAMIEVPAAALAAPQLARYCDFFSLGTNDLIQYTLAMDRVDDEINYLYDPLHPAVLQLIRMTIEAGHAAGIGVSMCGEMASDKRYTALLLGLGLTEFSMHPASVLEVKRAIMGADVADLKRATREILALTDAQSYRDGLDALSHRLVG
ncbi:phosphoenolpyruvate-protein phosphotransferase [Salinisphaera orenii MK-B5]|uniref:Phosphoenolpyruvate-protein phosphotransferase n=2 Tax=Salinisphaera orenii TaxID=856731 RepID=A0A423PHI2_9GAMM|nr:MULTISPECIES: phosphoenolpyruvate--protein phosphotransferase [Salinisphaera]ROO25003.1 phosphoenolpyruvate-protein phosphotransferase [Salinisphaera orenii MK-B5]ROO37691.1 phosphoenolpyruvate-protein phosphotransferase [Salinisphaera halophila YIM 95161]